MRSRVVLRHSTLSVATMSHISTCFPLVISSRVSAGAEHCGPCASLHHAGTLVWTQLQSSPTFVHYSAMGPRCHKVGHEAMLIVERECFYPTIAMNYGVAKVVYTRPAPPPPPHTHTPLWWMALLIERDRRVHMHEHHSFALSDAVNSIDRALWRA